MKKNEYRSYYDRKLEESEYSMKACVWSLAGMILIILLSFLISGCSPKVVTVPEVHTEYVYKTDSFVKRDSIHVKDSVFVHSKGDTVWVERFKTLYRDRWRDVVRIDSFVRRDSIPYMVEVEKPLTWWQRQKMEFGGLIMLVLSGLLVITFIRWKIK